MELSPQGKQLVQQALTKKIWTLEKLAQESNIGIATVRKFNSRRSVSRITFVTLCDKLGVDWQQASANVELPSPVSRDSLSSANLEDALEQQFREHSRQKILNQHRRMRLVGRHEIEVEVDQLYVDVWLLNRSPRTFLVSPSTLLETFDFEHDRLGLGDRIQRHQGFEVANTNKKLVILGKPGAGKTTFLKHLAVDWCNGKFQSNLIAVLVEFRRFRDEHCHLLDEIDKELGLENWKRVGRLLKEIFELERLQKNQYQKHRCKEIESLQLQVEELRQQVKTLLKQNKLLVLMDGLDELPTSELRQKVQTQLREIAEIYPENRYILTCRTQVMASIPNGFVSVEVAEFSTEQVRQFVQNWFRVRGKSNQEVIQQWQTFNHAINENSALKELTATPVLLGLMCLVLQDEGTMPSEKVWLYEKGINLLLSQWNDAKEIEEWEVGNQTYRELSIEQKEALLIKIAARKFENPNNFVLFEQKEIVNNIVEFLQLANPQEGIGVLKAIEAQHGLLIERADELWSFSHMTFQEHFTIQWLTQLPSKQLAEKITNRQWQQTIKRLVNSQQPADRFLRLIKQAIDPLIVSEPKLQKFMSWLLQKSESIQVNHKPAVRAFYFDLACLLILKSPNRINLPSYFYKTHSLICDHARVLTLDLGLEVDLKLDLNQTIARILTLNLEPELANKLKQLITELPQFSLEDNQYREWWKNDGQVWSQKFRQLMIEHRNIGHDWQFTNEQLQQLEGYQIVNKFLVDLMDIPGTLSNNTVRTEIEDKLLLSWEELQRHQ